MSKMVVAKNVGVKIMEQKKTSDGIVTVVKCVWPGVKLMFAAEVKNLPKKGMHINNVKRLHKMGFSLKAISTVLGVSPSYACRMLHS